MRYFQLYFLYVSVCLCGKKMSVVYNLQYGDWRRDGGAAAGV